MRSLAHHGVPVVIALLIIGLAFGLRSVAGKVAPSMTIEVDLVVSLVCLVVSALIVRGIGFMLIRPIPDRNTEPDSAPTEEADSLRLWRPGGEPFRPRCDDSGLDIESLCQDPETAANIDQLGKDGARRGDDGPHAGCGDI